ncbi:hypothetical protein FA95DRAFT_1577896 [Auriscalpium vulgare]|uniref:Uncharacterized protein n=1 Tax=Auriscalpium vulgare TaxID=40419 RepID=A0ACB8R4G0_9AGAM|nr:hypothetical protein FA95DRAFT_1577896 [Auriscalpium vulgare]
MAFAMSALTDEVMQLLEKVSYSLSISPSRTTSPRTQGDGDVPPPPTPNSPDPSSTAQGGDRAPALHADRSTYYGDKAQAEQQGWDGYAWVVFKGMEPGVYPTVKQAVKALGVSTTAVLKKFDTYQLADDAYEQARAAGKLVKFTRSWERRTMAPITRGRGNGRR